MNKINKGKIKKSYYFFMHILLFSKESTKCYAVLVYFSEVYLLCFLCQYCGWWVAGWLVHLALLSVVAVGIKAVNHLLHHTFDTTDCLEEELVPPPPPPGGLPTTAATTAATATASSSPPHYQASSHQQRRCVMVTWCSFH